HIFEHDLSLVSTKCQSCPQKLTDDISAKLHMDKSHHKGQFKCAAKQCAFEANTRLRVIEHYHQQHHNCPVGQHYRCTWPACPFTTTRKHHAIVHVCMLHHRVPATKIMQQNLKKIDYRDP